MNLPIGPSIEYIENVTNRRLSKNRYYSLRDRMQIEDTEWFLNFVTGTNGGGFLRYYRERMFVYENVLQKTMRQLSLELSSKPHEEQNYRRIATLTDHIIKLNTLLAQLGMSTPVLVAMKIANDPNWKDLTGIINEQERAILLEKYRKEVEEGVNRVPKLNEEDKDFTNYKKKKLNQLNREIGFGIAERQGNIRLAELYKNSTANEDTTSIPDRPRPDGEDSGEEQASGDGISEAERKYREHKDKAVF